jgi:hypothetical protein
MFKSKLLVMISKSGLIMYILPNGLILMEVILLVNQLFSFKIIMILKPLPMFGFLIPMDQTQTSVKA